MSDNIKLIIEIPKEDYKKLVNPYQHNEIWCERLKRIVINGTPLDSVKAEIEKHQFSREYCCDHNIDTAIDMGMVRIILDNIDKAESEDK